MVFVNNNGVVVEEGIYRNIHPQGCINEHPLNTEDVGLVILEYVIHFEVDPLIGSPSASGYQGMSRLMELAYVNINNDT
jgi:hypothetical protein